MNWTSLLFSLQGRVSRKWFWLVTLGNGALSAFLNAFVSSVSRTDSAQMTGLVLLGIVGIVGTWVSLAISVKRLHDRDRSGWWLAALAGVQTVSVAAALACDHWLGDAKLVPMIAFICVALAAGIWALIELGFLKGTPGPNRYGPDPLTGAQEHDA